VLNIMQFKNMSKFLQQFVVRLFIVEPSKRTTIDELLRLWLIPLSQVPLDVVCGRS